MVRSPVSRLLRFGLALGFVLAVSPASPAAASWPSDGANHVVVADGANEQVQPKLVPTADGGCYASWFDNAAGGYDVRLQRLSVLGNEVWAHNGVLVADRDFSSTQDYGLSIDTAGNALLAYRYDTGSGVHVYASKVDPSGTPLWGTPGIQVSSGAGDANSPRIAGTTDGNVVVAWSQGAEVKVQKLDAMGSPLWGSGVSLTPASGSFLIADLRASDAGTAIVSWVPNPARHLWAQKLASADGASLWAAGHVQVYDAAGGTLQFGNFPPFQSDGAGGAVFTWYTSSPSLQVRAQRILANGTEVFAHNGVEASTLAGQLRSSPSAAFDTATGDLYVFWRETNSLQNQIGVWGQRLDATGARQWTDSGQVIVPLGGEDVSQVNTLLLGAEPVVAWAQTEVFDDQPIRAARLDTTGALVWTPGIASVKTGNSGTSRLAGTVSSGGFAIYAWTDGETPRDLLAQNLRPDGTLGTLLFADGFETGDTGGWSLTVP
ncbi:MAG TPA: hypothetical protein VF017_14485 [Thermoanaerobaculia bacterium]|nr:hypothetical protein [Thermoanaerobaculia bacterium]